MFANVLAVLPLALSAFGSPISLSTRQSSSTWCPATLGEGSFDIAYNFTLAAYNTTTPNANSTGTPLVVGFGTAIEGAELHVLSTYSTYPYDDFPTFTLEHGLLHPNSPNNISIADTVVYDGDQLGFLQENNGPAGAQIYCGVASTSMGGGSIYPALAVNGDTDSFHLCSTGSYPGAQTNVVYKPQPSSYSYDYDSCYPVQLYMIESD